jgi:hypothetical protein
MLFFFLKKKKNYIIGIFNFLKKMKRHISPLQRTEFSLK